MKKSMLVAGAGVTTFAVASCLGPGDPIEIPEDWNEAARTCTAAQSLVLAANDARDEDTPVSFEQWSKTIQYGMIAMTKDETLDIASVADSIADLEPLMEKMVSKDFESAVIECEMRFGLTGKERQPKLPKSDTEAVFSCLAMSGLVVGGMQSDDADFGKKGKAATDMFERLEAKLETDPELMVKVIEGDPEALAEKGVRQAFAEGAPDLYVEACEKRFPAE